MRKNLLLLTVVLGASLFATAQDLSTCKNICEKTRIVESGPLIGVKISQIPNTKSVLVYEVIPNTAAQKNGIAVNDIITKFDGVEILSNQHLVGMVAAHQPGDKVMITYSHNNVVFEKQIALSALFSKTIIEKVCCDEPAAIGTAAQISIFPNPATSKIAIKSSHVINGEFTISIIDLKGSILSTNFFVSKSQSDKKLLTNELINVCKSK
jgi:membrane-associated protease RseP (regulator of RpoE activity)